MNSTVIDLRSDTVTQPTPEMRRAIFEAVVGDDVLGDDPTVIALQEKVARLLGKEAALFVPSGTMANQVSIRTHTEPGDEIIIEESGHAFMYETGALGGICGVQTKLVPGERGLLHPEQIESAIRPLQYHFPVTKLIVVENTHNQGGGTVYPLSQVQEIRKVADRRGIKVHMDGARLWNACIASDHAPAEYAQHCHSVSVCLSKGLGAPVGSMIASDRPFIERARRFRKMFGGGMRQSGILAAAGIYALDHHYERLREDHENARRFAEGLAQIPGILVRPEEVETNITFFGIQGKKAEWVQARLREEGVWVTARPDGMKVRAITHLDVNREQIDRAVGIVTRVARHE